MAKFKPKQSLDFRDTGIKKVTAILELKRVKQVDIWWSYRFVRQVLVNPVVAISWGKFRDDSGWALRVLIELQERWPQKFKEKRPKGRKLRSKSRKTQARRDLKEVKQEIKDAEKSSDYWERRFHSLPITDKRFMDYKFKVNHFRQLLARLKVEEKQIKVKLGFKLKGK